MEILLVVAALFLAFSNGANDNFKGFATVWGSGTLTYPRALFLATLATLAGSLASWFVAASLAQQFTGNGLVSVSVAASLSFVVSVACAAASTVFLATRLGFPVSTTHALIGALVGAGLAHGGLVHFDKLGKAFLLPLLVSPLLAVGLGLVAYRVFRFRRETPDCVCVSSLQAVAAGPSASMAVKPVEPSIVVATSRECDRVDATLRFSLTSLMDRLHIASAAAICFARGVNDTPKLVALLLAANLLAFSPLSVGLVGLAMAVGGVLFARRVAQTMSQRITRMDHASGFTANIITASLVLFASKAGLPVSTTHVAVGSIVGVGASAGTLDWSTLRNVLLSWVVTLPLAAALAFSLHSLL